MASEGRRGSDEAVRRLRAESRLRIGEQGRRRSFAGWCAVATLASGISLAALDSRESFLSKLQAEEAARTELREKLRQAAMERCQVLERKRQAIEQRLDWDVRQPTSDEGRALLRSAARRAFAEAGRLAAGDGCRGRPMRRDFLRSEELFEELAASEGLNPNPTDRRSRRKP